MLEEKKIFKLFSMCKPVLISDFVRISLQSLFHCNVYTYVIGKFYTGVFFCFISQA